jgi:L-asparagine permease
MSVNDISPAHAPSFSAVRKRCFSAEDAGYRKVLQSRQVQMIAIGGAIESGLFILEIARITMDYPVGTYSIVTLPIYTAALVVGWYMVRGRVRAI